MSLNTVLKLIVLPLWLVVVGCEGSGSSSDSSGNTTQTGRGGSTARMAIDGDYLYAIADDKVQVFEVRNASSPLVWTNVTVAWDIETLFPYGDYLLIGASSGMHIMDNRDRANPQYLSAFTHAQARDPVVAHNGFAYVTLKDDGSFGSVNQMDVINLFDIYNPTLEKTVAMQAPEGLTVFENRLYVCDGRAGIKIFDVTDPASPGVVESIPGVDCNDVIASEQKIYVITDNSLLQYDTTVSPPALLSTVATQ